MFTEGTSVIARNRFPIQLKNESYAMKYDFVGRLIWKWSMREWNATGVSHKNLAALHWQYWQIHMKIVLLMEKNEFVSHCNCTLRSSATSIGSNQYIKKQ